MRYVVRLMVVLAVLMGGMWFVPVASASNAVPLDGIVAVVNEVVITQDQLDQQMALYRGQLASSQTPIPAPAALRNEVLQHLIDEQLQLQLAKKLNVTASDADVTQAIAQIAQQNGLTVPQLQGKVQEQGLTYNDYKAQIQRQMIMSRLQQQEVGPRVKVTKQEINDEVNVVAVQPTSKTPEYDLQEILVPLPDAPTPQQVTDAQQRANDIVAKLHAGADFRQTAMAGANEKPPLQGGDLGMRKLADLPDLFIPVVQHMQPGDVEGPLRASNGFHIIKLADAQGTKLQQQLIQTHARHILIKVTPIEPDDVVQARLQKIRDSVEKGASFSQLAITNSEDLGSASKGGDLGWVNPGMLDPTFEAQMNKLQPGQISQPFKTQFGWHLVQVLARKTLDDKQLYLHNQAQQMVSERDYQAAVKNWLRELRAQAYVKVF